MDPNQPNPAGNENEQALDPAWVGSVPLPKPVLEEPKKAEAWPRSIGSLVLYIGLGYFLFRDHLDYLLILTGVVIVHELGHFLAMKWYDYKDLGIFFIPLLGAYASGSKYETSQKESSVILLAGPLPGIIAGIILFLFVSNPAAGEPVNYQLIRVSAILVYLNLFNLLPVYPLDGGQLLHRLFFDEYNIIGKIFVVLSSLLMAWLAIRIGMYPLLIFPLFIMMRFIRDLRHEQLVNKIEADGVNLTLVYDEITDEEYWKIRNSLIKHHPELQDLETSPPYTYSQREHKVVETMQGLLQRNIILDLSVAGKLLIFIIWIASFVVPIWLGIRLNLFGLF